MDSRGLPNSWTFQGFPDGAPVDSTPGARHALSKSLRRLGSKTWRIRRSAMADIDLDELDGIGNRAKMKSKMI